MLIRYFYPVVLVKKKVAGIPKVSTFFLQNVTVVVKGKGWMVHRPPCGRNPEWELTTEILNFLFILVEQKSVFFGFLRNDKFSPYKYLLYRKPWQNIFSSR